MTSTDHQRVKLQHRINQMKDDLNQNDMRYITQLLCRETEKYTETKNEMLFDLSNFSDETILEINEYLNITKSRISNANVVVANKIETTTVETTTSNEISSVAANDDVYYDGDSYDDDAICDPHIIALREKYYAKQSKITQDGKKKTDFDNLRKIIQKRCNAAKQTTSGHNMKHHVPEFLKTTARNIGELKEHEHVNEEDDDGNNDDDDADVYDDETIVVEGERVADDDDDEATTTIGSDVEEDAEISESDLDEY